MSVEWRGFTHLEHRDVVKKEGGEKRFLAPVSQLVLS